MIASSRYTPTYSTTIWTFPAKLMLRIAPIRSLPNLRAGFLLLLSEHNAF